MELSDDVWCCIFAQLNVTSRTHVTVLNKRLATLFNKWNDVTAISVNEGSACIASEHFNFTSKADLKQIISKCPNINYISIQSLLSTEKLSQLASFQHIIELHLPSSIISSPDVTISGLLLSKRIKKLRILQRYDEMKSIKNALRPSLALYIASLPLTVLQLQGVTIRPQTFSILCEGLKTTLRELIISGALFNSPDFNEYMSSIGQLSHLLLLDLPPSLFSLCHRSLPNKIVELSALPLRVLGIYLHYYANNNIASFISMLPTTLKELIVYRTTELDWVTWNKDFPSLNFKVYLCDLNDIIIDHEWLRSRSELLTCTLWLPPYSLTHNWPRVDLPTEWYQEILNDASDLDNVIETEELNTARETLSESLTEVIQQIADLRVISSNVTATSSEFGSIGHSTTSAAQEISSVSMASVETQTSASIG